MSEDLRDLLAEHVNRHIAIRVSQESQRALSIDEVSKGGVGAAIEPSIVDSADAPDTQNSDEKSGETDGMSVTNPGAVSSLDSKDPSDSSVISEVSESAKDLACPRPDGINSEECANHDDKTMTEQSIAEVSDLLDGSAIENGCEDEVDQLSEGDSVSDKEVDLDDDAAIVWHEGEVTSIFPRWLFISSPAFESKIRYNDRALRLHDKVRFRATSGKAVEVELVESSYTISEGTVVFIGNYWSFVCPQNVLLPLYFLRSTSYRLGTKLQFDLSPRKNTKSPHIISDSVVVVGFEQPYFAKVVHVGSSTSVVQLQHDLTHASFACDTQLFPLQVGDTLFVLLRFDSRDPQPRVYAYEHIKKSSVVPAGHTAGIVTSINRNAKNVVVRPFDGSQPLTIRSMFLNKDDRVSFDSVLDNITLLDSSVVVIDEKDPNRERGTICMIGKKTSRVALKGASSDVVIRSTEFAIGECVTFVAEEDEDMDIRYAKLESVARRGFTQPQVGTVSRLTEGKKPIAIIRDTLSGEEYVATQSMSENLQVGDSVWMLCNYIEALAHDTVYYLEKITISHEPVTKPGYVTGTVSAVSRRSRRVTVIMDHNKDSIELVSLFLPVGRSVCLLLEWSQDDMAFLSNDIIISPHEQSDIRGNSSMQGWIEGIVVNVCSGYSFVSVSDTQDDVFLRSTKYTSGERIRFRLSNVQSGPHDSIDVGTVRSLGMSKPTLARVVSLSHKIAGVNIGENTYFYEVGDAIFSRLVVGQQIAMLTKSRKGNPTIYSMDPIRRYTAGLVLDPTVYVTGVITKLNRAKAEAYLTADSGKTVTVTALFLCVGDKVSIKPASRSKGHVVIPLDIVVYPRVASSNSISYTLAELYHTGTLCKLGDKFGFIAPDGGGDEVFLGRRSCPRSATIGCRLQFLFRHESRGIAAVDVSIIQDLDETVTSPSKSKAKVEMSGCAQDDQVDLPSDVECSNITEAPISVDDCDILTENESIELENEIGVIDARETETSIPVEKSVADLSEPSVTLEDVVTLESHVESEMGATVDDIPCEPVPVDNATVVESSVSLCTETTAADTSTDIVETSAQVINDDVTNEIELTDSDSSDDEEDSPWVSGFIAKIHRNPDGYGTYSECHRDDGLAPVVSHVSSFKEGDRVQFKVVFSRKNRRLEAVDLQEGSPL